MPGLRKIAGLAALLAVAVVAASCDGGPAPAAPAVPEKPPNILLVITDDQRATASMQALPTVRRLFGRGGRTYTNAFATTPLCCPSRASIVSGRYAHNHGVHTNDDGMDLDARATVQRYLQDAGYRTAVVGKYLNRWDPRVNPRFFDRYAVWLRGIYRHSSWNLNGRIRRPEGYTTSLMTGFAERFLRSFEEDDEAPWYLWLGPNAPHSPYAAEHRYKGAKTKGWEGNPATRDRDVSDEPAFVARSQSSTDHARRLRRKQLRTLYSVDDQVAQVFELLRDLDEDDDTLAIFMSDNGFLWGEHGIVGKRHAYTQSIQIPLMMRWPGQMEPGSVDDRLAANLDLAPTLLDAAGVAMPPGFDGTSLLGDQVRDRLLIEQWGDEETYVPTMASLRTDDYQYVEYYGDAGRVVARQYYDLAADPWQRANLLGDARRGNDPDVRALSRRLRADRSCAGARCP
ncbi:MAG TPA: sulfatase-like hydrolase/transferase [Actinomycetota bacterium]|nr:sulfatase-like hydrolase/transferase [Actinomycetota bacterium]